MCPLLLSKGERMQKEFSVYLLLSPTPMLSSPVGLFPILFCCCFGNSRRTTSEFKRPTFSLVVNPYTLYQLNQSQL